MNTHTDLSATKIAKLNNNALVQLSKILRKNIEERNGSSIKHILDIGCGNFKGLDGFGYLSFLDTAEYATIEVTLWDNYDRNELPSKLPDKWKYEKKNFLHENIPELKEHQKFDLIVLSTVFHELYLQRGLNRLCNKKHEPVDESDERQALFHVFFNNLKSLLKSDGKIIIAENFHPRFLERDNLLKAQEYQKTLYEHADSPAAFIDPSEIVEQARQYGFELFQNEYVKCVSNDYFSQESDEPLLIPEIKSVFTNRQICIMVLLLSDSIRRQRDPSTTIETEPTYNFNKLQEYLGNEWASSNNTKGDPEKYKEIFWNRSASHADSLWEQVSNQCATQIEKQFSNLLISPSKVKSFWLSIQSVVIGKRYMPFDGKDEESSKYLPIYYVNDNDERSEEECWSGIAFNNLSRAQMAKRLGLKKTPSFFNFRIACKPIKTITLTFYRSEKQNNDLYEQEDAINSLGMEMTVNKDKKQHILYLINFKDFDNVTRYPDGITISDEGKIQSFAKNIYIFTKDAVKESLKNEAKTENLEVNSTKCAYGEDSVQSYFLVSAYLDFLFLGRFKDDTYILKKRIDDYQSRWENIITVFKDKVDINGWETEFKQIISAACDEGYKWAKEAGKESYLPKVWVTLAPPSHWQSNSSERVLDAFLDESEQSKQPPGNIMLFTDKIIPVSVLKEMMWCTNNFFDAIRAIEMKWKAQKDANNLRYESLKSAVAAIMSRNMSHNLGSHVVTNAKHQIMELEQQLGEEGVKEQLKGVSALLQYLQERQDFIAVIANDEHYPKGPLNFKSAVFDMIAMDGPSRRHDPDNEKNNEGKINNYILDNIIRSEDVVREGSIAAREEEGALKIELELVKVDAAGRAVVFKSLDQTRRIGNEFSDITLSVNNGLNGRQAFLTILENLIRNSAKHNKEALKHLGDDNTLLFSILFKESGNGYDITICDNKRDFAVAKRSMGGENAGILREGRLAPLRILREDGGGISRENKGYKEMLICLAWLKHGENIGAGGVREISYETLQNTPWELMDVVGVDHAHDYKVYGHDDPNPPPDLSLGHRFHIAKHKMIHLITPDELAGEDKGIFERLSELPSATLYAVRQSDYNRDPDNAVLAALPRLEVVPDSETEEGLREKSATLYERNVRRRFTAKLAAGGSLPPLRISGEATRNYNDFDARVVVRDDLGASADRAWEEAHGGEMFVHFRTHYETRLDDAIEAGKRGDADAVAKLAPAPGAFYTEGISGGNFTNTLIRTDIDRFAYCGIVEAALAQIAIVDERVFARCQGVTPKQREAANGAVPENPRWRHWEQLGIHVLNNDENGIFDLRGYYISSGAKSGMVYDFLSIHLGLIDKQTEEKTQAKIETERARLEAALEQFGDRYQAGRTRLSVHSGRGGMTEMGEKIAFFPLSGIEWALENCKFVLSDFLHGLKYPVFGEVSENSAAKAEPLERDAVPFGGRASSRATSVDVADARGKVPTLPQREKWRSPFARVNGQECGFSNPQKDYADRNSPEGAHMVRTPFATTIQTNPTHRKIFLVTTYHFDKGYVAGAAVDTGLAPEIGQFAAWDKIQSEMRDFAGHFTRITHIDETVFFYPCAKPRRVVVPPHRHGDFICHLVEKILGTHGSKDGRPIELHLVLHASDDGERRITNHYDAQSPLVERIRREHPGVASVGVWWFSHDGSGIHGNVLGDNRLFHGAASAEEKAWVLLRKLAEHASVKLPESAGVSGSAGLPSRIKTRILGRAETPRPLARALFHTLRIPDHVRLNRRTYLNRLAIWQLRGSDDQEALDTIFEPSGDDRDFWNPKFSPDDCASRLVAPRPLLVMGAKPLEVFGEKEQRANYLDNSIWCRYAASEEEAAAIRAEFERYDALGLYQSDVGKEYLEFTARSCVNSQFAEFSKSGHSQVVPIVFHSEGELRAKAGQHLADIRENYKGQLPLTWKILLIDDHVETPLAGAGISKLEVICKALEPLFSITVVKGGAEPPGDAPKKDLNILLHCVDSLDGAKELVVKNRYDMLFLDYLFSDSKETSDTFLRDLDQMAVANPTICGPFGQFWIFNVSAFAYALDRKLLAIGLSYHTKHWEFARGACAVNNPELFKHNLLAFMKTQLDRLTTLPSQELGGRKIITLLDLLRMIYIPGDNPRVRNQAVLHLQDVLSCQSDYERMLRDITHGLEKCAADLVHIQNNPCKSEIVHTLFPDIPYYNKAFWDHLTYLVQLTATGLPQQWPRMLMRFNVIKQTLLNAHKGPRTKEARELALAIENYIISLHPSEAHAP